MLRELSGRFLSPAGLSAPDALHTQHNLGKTVAVEELLRQYVLNHEEERQRGLYDALQEPVWAEDREYVTEDGKTAAPRPAAASSWTHPEMDPVPARAAGRRVIRTRTVTYWKGDGKTSSLVTETSQRNHLPRGPSLTRRKATGAHRRLRPPPLERRRPGSPGPRRHAP